MTRKEYQGLLETVREQVPLGIYALEKLIMQNSGMITARALHSSRQ